MASGEGYASRRRNLTGTPLAGLDKSCGERSPRYLERRKEASMDKQTWTLMGSAGAGAGLGAGLMYLLDPQGGRRRRAVARDKAASALNKGGDAVKKTSRDLGNRTKGLVAQVGSRLRQGEDVQVDDEVLCNRVRSKL